MICRFKGAPTLTGYEKNLCGHPLPTEVESQMR